MVSALQAAIGYTCFFLSFHSSVFSPKQNTIWRDSSWHCLTSVRLSSQKDFARKATSCCGMGLWGQTEVQSRGGGCATPEPMNHPRRGPTAVHFCIGAAREALILKQPMRCDESPRFALFKAIHYILNASRA